jgi:hypothetical protein
MHLKYIIAVLISIWQKTSNSIYCARQVFSPDAKQAALKFRAVKTPHGRRVFCQTLIMFFTLTAPISDLKAQKVNIANDSILIGDQTELSMRMPLDAGKTILFPQFEDTIIDGIEIVKKTSIDTAENKYLEQIFTITSFEDSTFIIPPFPFLADGDTLKSLSFMLTVSYFRPDSTFLSKIDTAQAIPLADIKAPINTPMTFAEFKQRYGKLILIILGALLLAAAIIYVYIRRKQNKPIFAAAAPKIPAHQKALKELEKVKEEGIPQGERLRKFYDKITYIIRVYIEDRFAVPAPDYISFEIIAALKTLPEVPDEQAENIRQLLQTADMVKFAKYTPEIFISEQNLNYAFDFVHATKKEEKQADEKNGLEANTPINSETEKK